MNRLAIILALALAGCGPPTPQLIRACPGSLGLYARETGLALGAYSEPRGYELIPVSAAQAAEVCPVMP